VSRRFVTRPQALKEAFKAAEWYDEQAAGLGARFLASLDRTIAIIHENPHLYAAVDDVLRRARLRGFPYSLIYWFSDEEIVLVACAHWRRNPRRWHGRR